MRKISKGIFDREKMKIKKKRFETPNKGCYTVCRAYLIQNTVVCLYEYITCNSYVYHEKQNIGEKND